MDEGLIPVPESMKKAESEANEDSKNKPSNDEKMDTDNHRGIMYKSSDELNSSDASDLITNGTGTSILADVNTAKSHVSCANIVKVYDTAAAATGI